MKIRLTVFLVALAIGTSLVSRAAEAFPPPPAQNMNSLFVISPYQYHGSWVFDDPKVGLNREPFIAGIDTIIDKLVSDIPDAGKGFRATFSASAFPGYSAKLVHLRPESGGNWYRSEELALEGWLCPALFKYFETAPREIYVKVEPRR